MSVFGTYSRYYNLLYKDKDYSGETEYICRLIREHHPKAKNILDLGCGTGKHDALLNDKGYSVTGVDMSEEMLAIAAAGRGKSTSDAPSPSFFHGDVRTIRLGATFDVVISLFHVMSYQVSNADLAAAVATAKAHLNPGGIFIFDFWYGPAVLATLPEVRIKRLEDPQTEIVRICEPVHHPNDNCIDVNYELLVIDKGTSKVEKIRERHSMRYLFMPEIHTLIETHGMRTISATEWMTGRDPGLATWSACVVAAGK